jgi:hypothetical protein
VEPVAEKATETKEVVEPVAEKATEKKEVVEPVAEKATEKEVVEPVAEKSTPVLEKPVEKQKNLEPVEAFDLGEKKKKARKESNQNADTDLQKDAIKEVTQTENEGEDDASDDEEGMDPELKKKLLLGGGGGGVVLLLLLYCMSRCIKGDDEKNKNADKDADKKAVVPLLTKNVEVEKKWEKWEDEDEDDSGDIELGDAKEEYKSTKIESLAPIDKTKVLGMFQNQKKTDTKTITTPSSKKPNLLIPTTPQDVDLFASTGIVAKPKFTEEKKESTKWAEEEDLLDE